MSIYTIEVLHCPTCNYQVIGDDRFGISHFKPGTQDLCLKTHNFKRIQCTHKCKDCGHYGIKPTMWVTWHTRPDTGGMCTATRGLHWEEILPPAPEVEFDDEITTIDIPKKIKFREFL